MYNISCVFMVMIIIRGLVGLFIRRHFIYFWYWKDSIPSYCTAFGFRWVYRFTSFTSSRSVSSPFVWSEYVKVICRSDSAIVGCCSSDLNLLVLIAMKVSGGGHFLMRKIVTSYSMRIFTMFIYCMHLFVHSIAWW